MTERIIYIFQLNSTEITTEVIEYLLSRLREYNIKFEKYSEISELSRVKPSIAIVEPFDLGTLETLYNAHAHIYSAKYANYCFVNEIPFPRMSNPLYSNILTHVTICVTEFDKKSRNNITMIAHALGGNFSNHLTNECTHLIVGKIGSRKYNLAQKLKIKLVSQDWIYRIWTCALENREISFDIDEKFYDECKIGIFYNLNISVTNLSVIDRENLRKIIVENGGKYSPELIFNECNILITGNLPNLSNNNNINISNNLSNNNINNLNNNLCNNNMNNFSNNLPNNLLNNINNFNFSNDNINSNNNINNNGFVYGLKNSKKIQAARRWKIPCVTVNWITKCLEEQKYIDFSDYLVDFSALMNETESPVMIDATVFPSANQSNLALNSGLNNSNGFKNDSFNNPIPANLSNSRTSFNDNSMEGFPNGYPNNFNNQNKFNTNNPNYHSSEVLTGLRLYISRSFDEIRALGLRTMIFQLNGEILDDLESATHFISDWSEDKIFKPHGIECIHSEWINECYKSQKLIPIESYILNKNSTISFPSFLQTDTSNFPLYINKENSVQIANTINFSNLIDSNENSRDAFPQIKKMPENDISLDEFNQNITQKRLKSIQDMRKQISEFALLNNTKENKADHPAVIFQRYNSNLHSESILKEIKCLNNNTPVQTPGLSQVIQYDDPTALNERKKLISLMNKSIKEPNDENINTKQFISPLQNITKKSPSALPNTSISEYKASEIVIQLASLEESKRILYSKIVQKLGGQVTDSEIYDENCTHVVAGTMMRSEKILCSLAAGKWILRESYIDNSELLGTFANEASHEWGQEPNPTEQSLACRKWRIHRKEKCAGAFNDWVVWLKVNPERVERYKRILTAGDAVVFFQDENSLNYKDITHIILDREQVISDELYHRMSLATQNIYFIEYLIEYLTDITSKPSCKYIHTRKLSIRRKKKLNLV